MPRHTTTTTTTTTTRRRFLATTAATIASINVVGAPARAAQYEYKLAHDLPITYPLHMRTVEMADAINKESNGRLVITVFPNSQLGGQTAMLSQLRSGAIQFLNTLDSVYSEVVPTAAIETVGFAFPDAQTAIKVMEGPLGAYVRKDFAGKGLYAFEKRWSLGMRQMCETNKPVKTAADFVGLKLRTPPGKMPVDLFTTLGASPTMVTASEMYTALQTHIVDAIELPLDALQFFKIYEVVKYVSLTNHMWSGYFLTANADAWNALPPDLRAIVERNAAKYALLEQQDRGGGETTYAKTLQSEGVIFNDPDIASMRAKLAAYYARWKATFGTQAWSLLQSGIGTTLGAS